MSNLNVTYLGICIQLIYLNVLKFIINIDLNGKNFG